MGAPQIIMIVLWAVGLTVSLIKHGQNRSGEHYSFWVSLLSVGIVAGLLIWGGFFG